MEKVIDGFALIGLITCLVWVAKGIKAWLAGRPSPEAEAPVPVPMSAAPANDDIAVIAAAVYAMIGAHRIVHIEDANKGQAWAAEGRWIHRTSHSPHH